MLCITELCWIHLPSSYIMKWNIPKSCEQIMMRRQHQYNNIFYICKQFIKLLIPMHTIHISSHETIGRKRDDIVLTRLQSKEQRISRENPSARVSSTFHHNHGQRTLQTNIVYRVHVKKHQLIVVFTANIVWLHLESKAVFTSCYKQTDYSNLKQNRPYYKFVGLILANSCWQRQICE